MSAFKRWFGKKQTTGVGAGDVGISRPLAGHETAQTTEEQAATRDRMEAELAAQREQRHTPSANV